MLVKLKTINELKAVNIDLNEFKIGTNGLVLFKKYTVQDIEISKSDSTVKINHKSYNTIYFNFYDEKERLIDIFKTKYNTYL